jgi:AcrR family transcriptional regulator
MVKRIIEAAVHVLGEHGYEGASTQQIAKAAGISVGSIYQYFPNKQSIVIAAVQDFVWSRRRALRSELRHSMDEPTPIVVERFVRTMVAFCEDHAGLLRVLVEETPRFGEIEDLLADHLGLRDLSEEYLDRHGIASRYEDVGRTLYLLTTAVNAWVFRIVLHPPAQFDRETLISEIIAGMLRYLRPQ